LSAGDLAGHLCQRAAQDLHLPAGIPIGSGVIDAYAGWIGTVGAKVADLEQDDLDPCLSQSFSRLAVVAGTSTCHLLMSPKPIFVDGIWGPYRDCVIPGNWMAEGGQSATGQLLKHVLETHPAYKQAICQANSADMDVYDFLNGHLAGMKMAISAPSIAYLGRYLFFYGDLWGNRSPIGDSNMSGSIVGLSADVSLENLALYYYGTMEFIALQTSHIVAKMNESGHDIRSIFMSGSQSKNNILMSLIATACNMPVVIPQYSHAAVCHGAAMLGAKAATADKTGKTEMLWSIMKRMSKPGRIIRPTATPGVKELLKVKYKVFHEQCERQRAFRMMVDSVLDAAL
jgi:FGGY-family pentulose kinase